MCAVKSGRGEVLRGAVNGSYMHSGAVVVIADTEAGKHGDGCFEFNSKCNGGGLGILRFHGWIWLESEAGEGRSARVPTSFFLPATRVVCRAPSRTIFAPTKLPRNQP